MKKIININHLGKNIFVLCLLFTLSVVEGLRTTNQIYAADGINESITLQGKVVNSDGTNVTDGAYDFVFTVYNGAGSSATSLFTESWTSAALFTSTMSTAPAANGESLVYSSNTNESSLKVGQILWNTTKQEPVTITAINTTTNTISISPTLSAWAISDTITNRPYVKDGIFRVAINSLNQNWSSVDFGDDSIFVGVNFNSDGEMKPRIRFSAVPYAMMAKDVINLGGIDASGYLRSNTDDTFETGHTLTIAGDLDVNGNLSVADTDVTFDGASTNFTTTGNFSINTNQLVLNKTTGQLTINGDIASNGNISGTWTGNAIGSQYGGTGADNHLAAQYSLPYYSNTGVLGGALAPGNTGYILVTNSTTGAPQWVDPSVVTGGTNYFQLKGEQISPKNALWNDILVGGDTTASAKIALQANTGNAYFSGNVGIGTQSPTTPLQVYSSASGSVLVGTGTASSGNSLRLGHDNTYGYVTSINAGTTYTGLRLQGSKIVFQTGTGVVSDRAIITSTGSLGLGTINPSALLTLASTTASESATLGSELLSSSNWTTTGWTGDFATGFTHTTGNTTALTNTLAAVTNNYYQIAFTVTGRTAGTFGITFGGVGCNQNFSASGTCGPKATSTGSLSITPSSDFDGTIILSIKQITNTYGSMANIIDSTGTSAFEMRTTLASLYNTFMGQTSGRYNTTGAFNTSLGANTLTYNTTGRANTAIGSYAMQSNTTGIFNTAIGDYSLNANTTGIYNSSVGGLNLQNNTTGSYNVAQGTMTLWLNTTGMRNTAIGSGSLTNTSTGSDNTAVGFNSGLGTSGSSFSNNSLFGRSAGYSLTTGSNNLLMGYQAADTLTTGANNIVLGYDIDLPTVSSSNMMDLGNLIYATGLNGNGTTVSTGSVGIGNAAPSYKLDVSGDINTTGTFRMNGTDYGQYFIDSAGIANNVWTSDGNGRGGWTDVLGLVGGTNLWQYNSANGIAPSNLSYDILLGATSTASAKLVLTSTGSAYFAQNVGIGVTNASARLTIQGTNSTAVLGSTLISNGDFATGDFTGWTNDGNWTISSNAAAHTTGSTAALSQTISVVSGTTYQIDWTQTGATAGTLTIAIGSQSLGSAYYSSTGLSLVASGTGSQTFSITPTTDYNGTIDNITVRAITTSADAVARYLDDTGTTFADVRGKSSLNNLGTGYYSLRYNTSGFSNTSYGSYALSNNTSGSNNTAIGHNALRSNINGTYNTAIGTNALYTHGSGSSRGGENTAVGYGAMYYNTTGYENSALGVYALYNNTTGGTNNAFGQYALRNNTTGSNNIGIGYNAGYNSQTGSNNTMVGTGAGYGVSGNSFSNNSLFGRYAGNALTTGGSNNLLLGYNAADALTTGANNIVLGYDIDLPAVSSSNMLDIGNLIYATGLTSTGTTVSTGSVGIGNAAPSYKLDVAGDINTTGTFRMNGTDYGQYFIDSPGTSGQVWASDGSGAGAWTDPNTLVNNYDYWQYNSANGIAPSNLSYDILLGATSTASAKIALTSTGSAYFSQNVGIGTTVAAANLDITGSNTEATYGTNLVTNGDFASGDLTGWTAAADWTYSSGAVLHTAGATGTLSQNITVNNGATYQIEWTESATAGSYTFSIGGVSSRSYAYWEPAIAKRATITVSGSGSQALTITPASNYSGSLDNITVRVINSYPQDAFIVRNSDGTYNFSVKAGGSGLNNLYLGNSSGSRNTTGANNTGLGMYALRYNTTGYWNTAIGGYALTSNTAGYRNVAMGYQALNVNTIGYDNTGIGSYALSTNSSGNYNTSIGLQSMQYNTTGSTNAALGIFALTENTTGNSNTGIGSYALQHTQTGNYNTALGYGAGAGSTGNSSSRNSIVGYYAGRYITGSNNLLLGYQAADALTTGANNIVLGYDIDLPAVSSSNMLDIGNLIYATGLTSTGTTVSTGSVGIGNAAPSYKLDVAGDINTTGTFRMNGTDYGQYFIDSAGTSGYVWTSDADGRGGWQDPVTLAGGTNYWQMSNEQISPKNALWHDLMIGGTTTASATIALQANTGNAYFSGNVGIGTRTPTSLLTVNSDTTNSYITMSSANGYNSGMNFYEGGSGTTYHRGAIYSNGSDNSLRIYSDTSAIYLNRDTVNDVVLVSGGGKTGIGTNSPASKLDIQGGYAGNAAVTINQTNTGDILTASSSGTTRMVLTNAGYLGISTNSPVSLLSNTSTNFTDQNSYGISAPYSLAWSMSAGGYVGAFQNSYNNAAGDGLLVRTSNTSAKTLTLNNSGTDIFTVLGSGYVGIGDNTPSYKLDVSGDINTTGTYRMNGTDYGQYFIDSAGTSGYVWTSDADGRGGWQDPVTLAGGTNYWQISNEQISPKNALWHDLMIGGTTTASAKIALQANTGNAYFSGNVGIGTQSPASKLDISGTAPILRITDTQDKAWSVGETMAGIEFYSSDNSGAFPAVATAIKSIVEGDAYGNQQGLGFFTNDYNASPLEQMRLSYRGYLGVGETNPQYRLDVSGDINTTGTFRMNGTDYGQYFIDGAGTSNQVWASDGAGRGAWTNMSSLINNNDYWQYNSANGIAPSNLSYDLLLGATSTASAKAYITSTGNSYFSGGMVIDAIPENNNSGFEYGNGYNPSDSNYTDQRFRINSFFDSPQLSMGVTVNYLLYTESFDNAAWVKTNIGTVTADSVGAPNGSTIAENIPAGSDATANLSQVVTNSGTGYWTGGVWLRAQSGSPTISLRLDSSAETGTERSIALDTKWRFYSVTQNFTTANTTKTLRIISGTNAISAWGARLNPGDTPNAYYARTSSAQTSAIAGAFFNNTTIYGSLSGNASSSTYSSYGSHGGFTYSGTTDNTNTWEYIGNMYIAYNSTYRYGSSWNVELNLNEVSADNTTVPQSSYDNIKLLLRGNLATVADSTAFNAATPDFSVELEGNTDLTTNDVAMLVYSTSTSTKYLRVYVKLKNPNTHYAIVPINRYGTSYSSTYGTTTSYVYFNTATAQTVLASLPTPAQGSVVYASLGANSNFWAPTGNDIYTLNSGNVGVGDTTPSYKLDVAGDINTTGTFRINGTDYGQYFIDGAGTSNQVWASDGAGRGAWTNMSSLISNNDYWQYNGTNGVAPSNLSYDVLVGGTTTASAKISLLTNGASTFSPSFTSTATGNDYGNNIQTTFTPTATTDRNVFGLNNTLNVTANYNVTGNYWGIQNRTSVSGSGNVNGASGIYNSTDIYSTGTNGSFYGINGVVVKRAGSGAVSQATAIRGQIANNANNAIANGYALLADAPINDGGGTIGNNFGLYVANQTAGTNNYAIYTNAGDVRFGDDVITTGTITGITDETINGIDINSGTISDATWNGSIISSQYGGTGANLSSIAQYSIPYFSASGIMGNAVAPGTEGYVLATHGAGSAPSWVSADSIAPYQWRLTAEQLAPTNALNYDVMIGGTTTASATIALQAHTGAITGNKLYIRDTDASNTLNINWNENDTANRALNLSVGGSDRYLTMNRSLTVAGTQDGTLSFSAAATLTVSGASNINQDVTTTANPTFAGVNADGVNVGITTANTIDTDSGNLVLGTTTDVGSSTTGLRIDTAGSLTDIDGTAVGIGENLDVTGSVRLGTTGTYNTLNTSAAGGAPSGNLYWGNRTVVDSSNVTSYAVSSLTSGNGLVGTATQGSVTVDVDLLAVADGTGATSSYSGLEFGGASSDKLTLLQGCADGETLKYTDSNGWACATDNNSGSTYTFTNGLSEASSTVKLGGNLTESTTITQDSAESLSFVNAGTAATIFNLSSTGDMNIQDNGTTFAQFNDSGRVGFGGTASANDYLVNIAANTTNDFSRALNITQTNDSNEDSSTLVLSSTANVGALSAGSTREITGITNTLTPTGTVGSTFGSIAAYADKTTLDISGLTLGSTSDYMNGLYASGTYNYVTGTPTINNTGTVAGKAVITAGQYANSSSITVSNTPAGTNIDTIGILASDSSVSDANSNVTHSSMGLSATAYSGLSTTGTTAHYAGWFSAGGTADNNYGTYISDVDGGTSNYGVYVNSVSGGTAGNYGLYINNVAASAGVEYAIYSAATTPSYLTGDMYINGNLGVGDTTPDHKLDVSGNIGLDTNSFINFGDTDGTNGYGLRSDDGTIQFKNSGGTWQDIGSSSAPTYLFQNGLTNLDNTVSWGGVLASDTTISNFAYNTNFNLNGTGDFNIQDSGSTFASFTDSGTFTLDSLTMDGTSLTSASNLGLSSSTTGNVIITSHGNAFTWPTSAGSPNYVMTTNGSGALSWADPTTLAGGTNYWQLAPAGEQVSLKNALWHDLMIGGTSTSAATIAMQAHTGAVTMNQLYVRDSDASNTMHINWNENDTSNRTLNLNLGGGDRYFTLNEDFTIGDGAAGTLTYTTASTLTVAGTSYINQDVRTTASPTFAGLTAGNYQIASGTPSVLGTTTGAMNLTPAAGSNLNVNLSGTGDFAVNTNQLYVDTSTGYVGIGTAAPAALLDVAGSTSTITNSSGDITINASSDQTSFANDSLKDISNIYVSGTIGVGTASPSQELDVVGDIELNEYLYFGNSNSNYLRFNGSNFSLSNNLLPSNDNAYTLGSDTARWKDLFLGSNSLHIGSSTSDEFVISYNADSNLLTLNANGAGDPEFTFTADGNFGIGNTSPTHKLSIGGSSSTISNTNGDLYLDSYSNNVNFSGDALTNIRYIEATGSAGLAVMNIASSSGTPIFNIAANGKVGIGTTSPGRNLDIQGGNAAVSIKDTTTGGHQYVLTNLSPGDGSLGIYDQTNTAFRMLINSSGNVGIGRTDPSYTLDVNGTGRFGAYAMIGTNVAAGYYQDAANGAYRANNTSSAGYYFQSNNGASTPMFVGLAGTYAGRVGINTASPAEALDVAGMARFGATGSTSIGLRDDESTNGLKYLHANSDVVGFLGGGGTWMSYLNTSGNWNPLSDERLKTNVETLSGVLEKIDQIRGVSFNWKDTSERGTQLNLGVIAQEVEKVFPELVSTDSDGYKHVSYEVFAPVLIEGIKELNQNVSNVTLSSLNDAGELELVQSGDEFTVTKSGSILDNLGAFAEAVIAKLRVGSLTAQKAEVKELSVDGKSIDTMVAEEVAAQLSQYSIASTSGENVVSSIQEETLARLSSVEDGVATIAGAVDYNSDEISTTSTRLTTLSTTYESKTTDIENLIATMSARLDKTQVDLENLYLTASESALTTDLTTEDATSSSDLILTPDMITANMVTINDFLSVTGESVLTNVTITNSLTFGNWNILQSEGLLSFGSLLTLNSTGNLVTINGDLAVTGKVTATDLAVANATVSGELQVNTLTVDTIYNDELARLASESAEMRAQIASLSAVLGVVSTPSAGLDPHVFVKPTPIPATQSASLPMPLEDYLASQQP
jgi:hypothetical protein